MKKINKIEQGFIQIPILLLIVFGALAATGGGYYAVKHTPQFAKQDAVVEEKNETAMTSTETSTSTVPQLDNTSKRKKGNEQKPPNLSDYSASVPDEKENEPKEDILAIKSKLLEQLATDAKDFTTLLKNVRDDRERWINLAESHAGTRYQSLNVFGTNTTFLDIKQFVLDTANHYRQDKENARLTYIQLYKPLEETISFQIGKTRAIDDGVWGKIETDQLRGYVLLSENRTQMDSFLVLAMKANAGARDLEDTKSDYYEKDFGYIRALLSVYGTSISISQRLLEIEQEARTRTLPKTEIRCWTTTQYSGGIVNGTSQTSIRCE